VRVIARKNRNRPGRNASPAVRRDAGGAAPEPRLEPGIIAVLCLSFLGVAWIVYQPAFSGPFLSDDIHYVANNAFIHELSVENIRTIFDPVGPATIAVVNYSPIQLMIHSLAWQVFGAETAGHHAVNVVLHAIASVLLVALFRRTEIPLAASIFGGAFFLLHPANVEAVAWISQLKSSSALVLSLAALLVFPRRHILGTSLFVLALLAKPTAAYLLPVAVLLALTRDEPVPWRWFASWAVIFVAFAAVELSVHQRSGAAEAVLYDTPLVLVRTILGLAMRYLVMAATSLGVSAFHDPDPIHSALDPWWIFAVISLALLGWRTVVVWRRRNVEVAYWVWAVVSFAPISQIFPFLHPMADRYLYFILPGLLGGALLAGSEALTRVVPVEGRKRAAQAAVALGVVVCVAFAAHSHARAGIWRFAGTLSADSARNYPNGVSANLIRAKQAAFEGNGEAAGAALQAAHDRGFNRFEMIYSDAAFDPVRRHPAFVSAFEKMARGRIARVEERKAPTQGELRMAGHAYIALGEYEDARRMLKVALEHGGIHDDAIRNDLNQLA
jgi:hypothetical protein